MNELLSWILGLGVLLGGVWGLYRVQARQKFNQLKLDSESKKNELKVLDLTNLVKFANNRNKKSGTDKSKPSS